MAKISPLAYIDPSAKIGENCEIGPFSFIDKNVEIGDNNVLMNNVTLLSGTRMGNENTLFPGAVIGAIPQDLKFKGEETTAEIGDNNPIRENVTIQPWYGIQRVRPWWQQQPHYGKCPHRSRLCLRKRNHHGQLNKTSRRSYRGRQCHHQCSGARSSVLPYRRIHNGAGRKPHEQGHSTIHHWRKRADCVCRTQHCGSAQKAVPERCD